VVVFPPRVAVDVAVAIAVGDTLTGDAVLGVVTVAAIPSQQPTPEFLRIMPVPPRFVDDAIT